MGALELGDAGEDGVGDFGCGQVAKGAEQGGEALVAVHLALGVLGVENAVGDEDDGVAGLGVEADFVVSDVGEEAQREALGADDI